MHFIHLFPLSVAGFHAFSFALGVMITLLVASKYNINKQLYFFNLHISTQTLRQHVRPKSRYPHTKLPVINKKHYLIFK